VSIPRVRKTKEPATESRRGDVDELNDPRSLAIRAVAFGACILDVGCASGAVARALAEHDCRVFGVEIDPVAADAAKANCERVVVADAEVLDWQAAFASIRFDAILFLDVLEHLREPARVLRRVQGLLNPDGRILASIPNIAHGAVRLQLLDGRFPYAESGLLDRGHLRFFDSDAVEHLFAEAGYRITERIRIMRGLSETEIPIDLGAVPQEILRSLEEDPEALTYQFFVVAAPRSEGSALPLAPEQNLIEAHRGQVRELVRLVREGEVYTKRVVEELAHKEEHIRRLEQSLRQHEEGAAYAQKLQEELAGKEKHIRRLEQSLRQHEEGAAHARKLQEELAGKEEHIRRLEQSLRQQEEGAAYAQKLQEELAGKEEHIRRLEQSLRQHEEGAAYARKLQEELAGKEEHISHLEGGLRTLGATAAERETALRELTAELRERIVEIEAAREERICLERELLIRNEYLSELRQEIGEADAKLRGLEAEIERMRHAEGEGVTLRAELRAAHERMTAFEDFVQQPRHQLSDRVNSWMRREVPTFHRVLRPLVLVLSRHRKE
jgi:2-polyprenyl-3-methyl-5-hydroxy-6-metoxy-1,4-benzoquinol methylase/exonuclease VII small subunit